MLEHYEDQRSISNGKKGRNGLSLPIAARKDHGRRYFRNQTILDQHLNGVRSVTDGFPINHVIDLLEQVLGERNGQARL
jgi:hypothetical protein